MTGEELDPDRARPDADGITRRSWAIGGAALSALETGEPDQRDDGGPLADQTIVLLHGIPASAELWRGVMPDLAAAGHHVVAFDLPGYGQTLLPAGADHSLGGAAQLVATWIRLHVGRGVWVVGHDLGGGVAEILLSREPTLLSRLTLTNAVFEDSWPVLPVRLMRQVARSGLYPALAAARLFPNPYARHQLRRGFADPSAATDDLARRVFWDGKVSDDGGRRAFARHLRSLDPEQTVLAGGSLSRLTVPTQVVWGRQDVFQAWDEVGVRVRDALPDPDVTLLDDAGHYAPVERADAFARALLDWEPRVTS